MRVQLDTEKKTIKLENDVLLSELIDTAEKLLPGGEWKKFTLETNTVIHNWKQPIYIREYPRYVDPDYWPWYSTNNINVSHSSHSLSALNTGVYNLEVGIK